MMMTSQQIKINSISAVFYHPHLNRMFMVANRFLYIYESITKNPVDIFTTSRCSVTLFNRFFNCSQKYYKQMPDRDIEVMMMMNKNPWYRGTPSKNELIGGSILYGQCNWMPSITLGNITFMDKIMIQQRDDDDHHDNFWLTSLLHWEYLNLISGVVLGLMILVGIIYLILWFINRRRRRLKNGGGGDRSYGSVNSLIRKREQRLKEFLHNRYLTTQATLKNGVIINNNNNKKTLSVESATLTGDDDDDNNSPKMITESKSKKKKNKKYNQTAINGIRQYRHNKSDDSTRTSYYSSMGLTSVMGIKLMNDNNNINNNKMNKEQQQKKASLPSISSLPPKSWKILSRTKSDHKTKINQNNNNNKNIKVSSVGAIINSSCDIPSSGYQL